MSPFSAGPVKNPRVVPDLPGTRVEKSACSARAPGTTDWKEIP